MNVDFSGTWSQKIYNPMSSDTFYKFLGKIDDEVYRLTNNWWNRLWNSVGKFAIGSIKNIGVFYSVIDTVASFTTPSQADQLGTLRYYWEKLFRTYGYKKTRYKFKVYVLSNFGNQAKLEVIDTKQKNKIVKTCAMSFKVYGISIIQKLNKWLKSLGIKYKIKSVTWKYSYMKK